MRLHDAGNDGARTWQRLLSKEVDVLEVPTQQLRLPEACIAGRLGVGGVDHGSDRRLHNKQLVAPTALDEGLLEFAHGDVPDQTRHPSECCFSMVEVDLRSNWKFVAENLFFV